MLTPSTPACFAGLYPTAEPGTARSGGCKPALACVQPQKGFLVDVLQRQSATVSLAG